MPPRKIPCKNESENVLFSLCIGFLKIFSHATGTLLCSPHMLDNGEFTVINISLISASLNISDLNK
jgi:hypothetical protein